jgi:hypothetical protein
LQALVPAIGVGVAVTPVGLELGLGLAIGEVEATEAAAEGVSPGVEVGAAGMGVALRQPAASSVAIDPTIKARCAAKRRV